MLNRREVIIGAAVTAAFVSPADALSHRSLPAIFPPFAPPQGFAWAYVVDDVSGLQIVDTGAGGQLVVDLVAA